MSPYRIEKLLALMMDKLYHLFFVLNIELNGKNKNKLKPPYTPSPLKKKKKWIYHNLYVNNYLKPFLGENYVALISIKIRILIYLTAKKM